MVVDGIEEEDLVLRWGFVLAEALSAAGYDTRMSRTGDYGASFPERIDEARDLGARMFISLHMTQKEDPALWGTEIFLAEELPASVAAAETISEALESIGADVIRIGQPWDVLKTTEFPTLMIELGHLSNPVERRLLLSRAYWEQVSAALVEGMRSL